MQAPTAIDILDISVSWNPQTLCGTGTLQINVHITQSILEAGDQKCW